MLVVTRAVTLHCSRDTFARERSASAQPVTQPCHPPVTNVPKPGLHRDATIRTLLACVPDPPPVPLVLSPPLFMSVAPIRTRGFVMVCTCLVHGLPMASPPLRAVLTGLGGRGRRSEATSPPNRPLFLFSTMPCHVVARCCITLGMPRAHSLSGAPA